jgi:hypothetical protein
VNKLKIPYVNRTHTKTADELMKQMEAFENLPISCNPWPEFVSDTEASFIIAHDKNAILLKYKISEKYLIANEVNNGDIHNDSCVEFFIAFDNDDTYYNLEFNCLGFTKIGYGSQRSDRELLPIDVIKKMSFSSKINSNMRYEGEGFDWEILLVIPKEIFIHHHIGSFDQLLAKGNFYKCGDGLPEPHFLSWNMVISEEPDFHITDSFGHLEFTSSTK